MEYTIFLLALIAVVASPFVLWIHARRDRWRRPRLAMKVVVTAAAAVVFGLSAAYGYLYPWGHPGAEMPSLRAVGNACWTAYTAARTAPDSAAVDRLQPLALVPDSGSVLSCATVRNSNLLGCRPGTRCARIKSRLRLPGA